MTPVPASADLDNVTGRAQPVGRVHRPCSTAEVVALVQVARASGTPLYPVSCGLNWGYGSASPVLAGGDRVDLGGMAAIRNADAISLANPVALIEPGVTQGQLADFLRRHCPALTFNVTGSARDTSIIGNALDRGVGYFGPRREDLFGLEVVAGSGQVVKTGFRRLGEDSPLAHCHPYGLGPMLDGLFFQGNFGIVTSACLRLVPRRPVEVAVSMALRREADLARFIDLLAEFKREALIASVTHIGNRARTHGTLLAGVARYLQAHGTPDPAAARAQAQRALDLAAPDEWTSLGAITGNAAQVRAAVRELRRRLRGVARLSVVTERRLKLAYAAAHRLRALAPARAAAAVVSAVMPLHGLALGQPCDVAVEGLLWQMGDSARPVTALDHSDVGLIYISPAMPMSGRLVVDVLQRLRAVAEAHGHVFYVTVNIETPTSLVAIINLLFRRSEPGAVAQAHRCADAMLAVIREQGLEIYRARADMMAAVVGRDPAHWALVAELKRVFDPDHIIAPGRYCPAP